MNLTAHALLHIPRSETSVPTSVHIPRSEASVASAPELHIPRSEASMPIHIPRSEASITSPGPEPPSHYRPRRRWTPEEDAKLIAGVKRYGCKRGPGSKWSLISEGLPGRTNKDCRKRWFHSLDPDVRKGKWSPEEDDALRRLYAELGPQWKEIALRIPGRKDDQVSKRWRDVLSPELTSKKPWSDEEDALLLHLLELKGPRWTAISDRLPGRSPIACRNRSRKYRNRSGDGYAPSSATITATSLALVGEALDIDMDADSKPPSTAEASTATSTATSTTAPSTAQSAPSTASDWLDLNGLELNLGGFDAVAASAPQSMHAGADLNSIPAVPTADPLEAFHAAESTFLEGWLAGISSQPCISPASHGLGIESQQQQQQQQHHQHQQQHQQQQQQHPLSHISHVPHTPQPETVNSLWSLLVALDRGDQSVTVNSNILRQIISATHLANLKG